MALVPAEAWMGLIEQSLREAGRAGTVESLSPIYPFVAAVGASVAVLLTIFVTSVFTYGLFVGVMGDKGSFLQHLTVVAHASLIPALGALVILPLRIALLDPQFHLSIGSFLPPENAGFLADLASGLDLFSLWGAVLVGIGIATLDGRRDWRASTATLIVFFTAVVGLQAALA